jgi:hypothetical protein
MWRRLIAAWQTWRADRRLGRVQLDTDPPAYPFVLRQWRCGAPWPGGNGLVCSLTRGHAGHHSAAKSRQTIVWWRDVTSSSSTEIAHE